MVVLIRYLTQGPYLGSAPRLPRASGLLGMDPSQRIRNVPDGIEPRRLYGAFDRALEVAREEGALDGTW
jgi:hypothetical protein